MCGGDCSPCRTPNFSEEYHNDHIERRNQHFGQVTHTPEQARPNISNVGYPIENPNNQAETVCHALRKQ